MTATELKRHWKVLEGRRTELATADRAGLAVAPTKWTGSSASANASTP
jgi:hypothetical protein